MEIEKKKALIITYYWPPAGGSGVQRCLKFTKYLPDFGWQPTVYTVKKGEFPVIDNSLENDIHPKLTVIRSEIWEPYQWYKRFTGKKKQDRIGVGFISDKKSKGLSQQLSVWIRGNFFIPDARKFWVNPSVKFLKKYIIDQGIQVIMTSGPPHSCHLIGLKLKQLLGIPWIADFRDPWTEIYYYKDLKLTSFADKKHRHLEQQVLDQCNHLVVVGETMKERFAIRTNTPIEVISNGYDGMDYDHQDYEEDQKFTLSHIGMLMKSQDPILFWEALRELLNEIPGLKEDLEIRIVGKADHHVLQSINRYELSSYLNEIGYVPHNEVVKYQKGSQVLLLFINKVPNARYLVMGKLFEYLASRRPLFCLGPVDGDAAHIIREAEAGIVLEQEDKGGIKEALRDLYSKYKEGKLKIESRNIEQYSRKNLSKRLAKLMDNVIHINS